MAAQRAARLQDAVRDEELANTGRLREAQLRQEQEELARASTGRERHELAQIVSGPSY